MASQASFLTAQFLAWVTERPRSRADLGETWQSTCPLNSPWEDAVAEELVTFDRAGHLRLTERGQARLRQGSRRKI